MNPRSTLNRRRLDIEDCIDGTNHRMSDDITCIVCGVTFMEIMAWINFTYGTDGYDFYRQYLTSDAIDRANNLTESQRNHRREVLLANQRGR